MTIEQQRRQRLLDAAKSITNRHRVTDEDRADFDRIMARVDAMDRAELHRGHAPPRGQPGSGWVEGVGERRDWRSDPDPEYRAIGKYIVTGERDPEMRDLGTTSAIGAGAQFIPQAFYPVLTEAKKAWGNVTEVVNLKETNDGAPMKIAFSNDTGNLAQVVGETGPISEVDPALSSILLNTDQCATDIIKISIAELQDSAFDLDAFVRDQFGKRYYRGLTSLITNGSPSGNIQSLISGAFPAVTSLYSNAIDYDDITGMYGALDPAYIDNACWMMKSTTRATLLGVKDSLGRPLYVPSPTGGAFDKLLGLPVVLNQYMDYVQPSGDSPSTDCIPLLLGDFKQGYLLRNVKPGLAITRLNERYMDTLEVGFLGYFRSGGVVTDAGTHPIIALTMNSTGAAPASDN